MLCGRPLGHGLPFGGLRERPDGAGQTMTKRQHWQKSPCLRADHILSNITPGNDD
jgi:hypothetical protein